VGNIHQQASGVRNSLLMGKVGDLADSDLKAVRSFSGFNIAPQAKNVWTVTVDTATNGATYTISVEGRTITYVADGSTSTSEISAGLAAAIQADPLAYAACTVSDGGGTVVITGRVPGYALTVSESDAKLSLAETTSEDSADSIDFGDAVIFSSAAASNYFVARADGAYLTTQVDTITFSNTYSAGEVISAWVEVPGYPRATAAVIAATDLDTSLAALVTALNASIDALIGSSGAVTAAYTTSGNIITLTAQQAGKAFKASFTATTNTFTHTSTASNALTDAAKVFAGIALRKVDVRTPETATVRQTLTSYAPNEGVAVANEARVIVASSANPNTLTDAVWLGLSGSERGKLFTAAAASRVLLPPEKARWNRPQRSGDTDGIAVVSLNVLV
jgi:hypothetical protein